MYKAIGKEGNSGGCQGLLASPAPSSLSPVSSDLGGIRDTPPNPGSEYSFLGTWESSGILTCIVYVNAYVCLISLGASECVHVCIFCTCVSSLGKKKISIQLTLPQLLVPSLPLWPQHDNIYRTYSRVACCWLGPPLVAELG